MSILDPETERELNEAIRGGNAMLRELSKSSAGDVESATMQPDFTPNYHYDEQRFTRDADPNDSMFVVMSANEAMQFASLQPDPVSLYDTLWYEGEVCCLFADSNVGKSIFAMQIATYVAKSHTVLYFDFELSVKQFQLRYTGSDGRMHIFPNNLHIVRQNYAAHELMDTPIEKVIMRRIEQTAFESGADVLIIDNLTYLCLEAEKGEVAGRLMKELMAFKATSNLSVLVLAHTPKRPMDRPITQNDLAGSKKLINFFDSAFAIGKSIKDESLRYIKQVKVRSGEFTYDSDNVKVCEIVKDGSFLYLRDLEQPSSEQEHLRESSDEGKKQLRDEAQKLRDKGLTYQEVADKMQLSKTRVFRLLAGS